MRQNEGFIRLYLVAIVFGILLGSLLSCSKAPVAVQRCLCEIKIGADLIRVETRPAPQLSFYQNGDTTTICKLKK